MPSHTVLHLIINNHLTKNTINYYKRFDTLKFLVVVNVFLYLINKLSSFTCFV